MSHHYKGVVIAPNQEIAKRELYRMRALFDSKVDQPIDRQWLIVTPNRLHAGRGLVVPNRVLVIDYPDFGDIPEQVWEAVVPCLRRDSEVRADVTYWTRERFKVPITVTDHVFTVPEQRYLKGWPPELPCAAQGCGRRSDEHVAVSLASEAFG